MTAPIWDGTIEGARALQATLAPQVVLRDGFTKPLRVIGGFAAGFSDDGAMAYGAGVLVDAENLDVLDAQVVQMPAAMRYVPGLLSFRELPPLLDVLERLSQLPDVAMVFGAGIAHSHRFGIASHFGVASGVPSIGVATKAPSGNSAALQQVRGAYTPLRERGEQIGWMLRSKLHCQPLTVSPGHRVAMASTADLVMRYTRAYRLPEPVRLALRLASRRAGHPDAASHE
jgi:deoxyribonuclease V